MKISIFQAAYNACSGVTDLGDALRIVSTQWPKAFQDLNSALPPPFRMTQPSGMNVPPNTGFIRKVANLPDKGILAHSSDLYQILSRGVTPSLQSVAQLVCLFLETNCTCTLGACRCGGFLSVLTARLSAFENTLASCFVPKCWVGFLSLVRTMSFLECMRALATSLDVFSHQLPGHYRFEVDVEHELYSIVWTQSRQTWKQQRLRNVRGWKSSSNESRRAATTQGAQWCGPGALVHGRADPSEDTTRITPLASVENDIEQAGRKSPGDDRPSRFS